MSKIITLKEEDTGKWVYYKKEERGKIKSFNNDSKTAWVVYKCNNNWDLDHWKDYTACATNYSDLSFKKEF